MRILRAVDMRIPPARIPASSFCRVYPFSYPLVYFYLWKSGCYAGAESAPATIIISRYRGETAKLLIDGNLPPSPDQLLLFIVTLKSAVGLVGFYGYL